MAAPIVGDAAMAVWPALQGVEMSFLDPKLTFNHR
jgi:hypothetical protein